MLGRAWERWWEALEEYQMNIRTVIGSIPVGGDEYKLQVCFYLFIGLQGHKSIGAIILGLRHILFTDLQMCLIIYFHAWLFVCF